MGMYLNPGNTSFWKSISSKIYVDKTGLIAQTNERINTQEQYICVSRPRRFGKSMALNMLAAYYSRGCESMDLFRGRKIESDKSFRENLNRYDVILLNMQQFLIEAEPGEVTQYLEQEVRQELKEEALEGYTGEILLVGINYDRENANKPHSCVIERMEKQTEHFL